MKSVKATKRREEKLIYPRGGSNARLVRGAESGEGRAGRGEQVRERRASVERRVGFESHSRYKLAEEVWHIDEGERAEPREEHAPGEGDARTRAILDQVVLDHDREDGDRADHRDDGEHVDRRL